MTTWDKEIYALWKAQHPTFDSQDYARWVQSRGYYRAALDVSRPEFYEYVNLYLSWREYQNSGYAASPAEALSPISQGGKDEGRWD
jgi:hypothetical protein